MNKSSSGLGFTSVLTIVFVTLKLVGTIDWSWWWVLSPLWIGFVIFCAIVAGMIGVAFGIELWKK